ncbi:MAG: HAMP domain-containing histidine kinase [Acidobacteria bacterium]|nr:HAMP domain-containing histidine kinase [Acidobacteriota bacterium]
MRIRTQLFIGTAALVLALLGVQWGLQVRQLRDLDQQLAETAADVTRTLVFGETGRTAPEGPVESRESRRVIRVRPETAGEPGAVGIVLPLLFDEVTPDAVPVTGETMTRTVRIRREEPSRPVTGDPSPAAPGSAAAPEVRKLRVTETKSYTIKVSVDQKGPRNYVVIAGLPQGERRIPVPKSNASEVIRATLHQGLIAGIVLLAVGLVGGALVAHRVTKPIRRLKSGAEAVGRGELGTQVAVESRGELRDLEMTFNRMSRQLAELEVEKQSWKAREHLAELGGLARGLAHTLRNPLNTFGLVIEELGARGSDEDRTLVATAQAQIRRIDRWVRSLLAVGKEGALEPEPADIVQVVTDMVFESLQAGNRVELRCEAESLPSRVILPALRPALANLVENAAEASPADRAVEVEVGEDGEDAVIVIRDHGPGLPGEVRRRLYAPHVTTKPEGSGMGIYLSRQLIEGIHGGKLDIGDDPGGGTVVTVRIPRQFPGPGEKA